MTEAAKIISRKTRLPVVFAFNILNNYYKEFGVQHFLPIKRTIQNIGYNVELLPIVNLHFKSSIESRAAAIREQLPEVLDKMGAKQCHLMAYSVSGIDARHYISNLGGNEYINTLTTISTPHRGSFLADSYNERLVLDDDVDPITRLMGIPQKSFKEFCTSNIEAFNVVAPNQEKVKYYSCGALREGRQCSELFIKTQNYIHVKKERNFPSDNDGVFALDEAVWGKHLMNIVGDHAEIAGLRVGFNIDTVYRNIFDKVEDY